MLCQVAFSFEVLTRETQQNAAIWLWNETSNSFYSVSINYVSTNFNTPAISLDNLACVQGVQMGWQGRRFRYFSHFIII